jgi:DNA-binding response OmpR family regulator
MSMTALPAKKKILVIEDDAAIRDAFRIIFESAGYQVELKEDPNEILNNNFSKPDVFLIDRLLPGVDGLEICRYLKQGELTKDIPVIMISAAPGVDVLARGAGADDYIEKPFDRGDLLQLIDRHISVQPRDRTHNAI